MLKHTHPHTSLLLMMFWCSHLLCLNLLIFRQSGGGVKPNKQKYSYQRPAFLKLATEDEIQVIFNDLCPRWNFVIFLHVYLWVAKFHLTGDCWSCSASDYCAKRCVHPPVVRRLCRNYQRGKIAAQRGPGHGQTGQYRGGGWRKAGQCALHHVRRLWRTRWSRLCCYSQ